MPNTIKQEGTTRSNILVAFNLIKVAQEQAIAVEQNYILACKLGDLAEKLKVLETDTLGYQMDFIKAIFEIEKKRNQRDEIKIGNQQD